MKNLLLSIGLLICFAGSGWAACPTPLTVKDAAGTTQNISTTDDGSGNCQSNVVVTDPTGADFASVVTAVNAPGNVQQTVTNFSGHIALTAATSTALTSGNVTMDTNSAGLPSAGAFQRLQVVAPSGGTVNVCWFGGTCSATTGEALGAGTYLSGDSANLTGQAAAPTMYSTVGATVYFRN